MAKVTAGFPSNRRGQVRKDRNKIKIAVATRRKIDSAKWRDATLKPLTYAQDRIKALCEGFLKGEITSEQFRLELPTILDTRDQEKRKTAHSPNSAPGNRCL
jgi:hypothetical protein